MNRIAYLVFMMGLCLPISVTAWEEVIHKGETAHKLEGKKISGRAETSGTPYILISARQDLPELTTGKKLSFQNIIFNYGDNYICGIKREVKIKIDGELVPEYLGREPDAPDEWHVFRKGFLQHFFGEVLSYESFFTPDRSAPRDDLAYRLRHATSTIQFERKFDNCGDDGIFIFTLPHD